MKKISRLATTPAKLVWCLVAFFASPLIATAIAQGGINDSYLQEYKSSILGIVNGILVPVLIAIAFIVFLYGAYKYFILGAAVETEREAGRTVTLYGVIGFVIITSLWGIVNVFSGTLNLGGYNAPAPPTIYGAAGSSGAGGIGGAGGQRAIGSSCTSDTQCASNFCALNGSCRYPVGVTCTTNEECATGICDNARRICLLPQ